MELKGDLNGAAARPGSWNGIVSGFDVVGTKAQGCGNFRRELKVLFDDEFSCSEVVLVGRFSHGVAVEQHHQFSVSDLHGTSCCVFGECFRSGFNSHQNRNVAYSKSDTAKFSSTEFNLEFDDRANPIGWRFRKVV